MRTDKSSRVGGRRKAGPAATKKSVAKAPRGKPIVWKNGQAGYQHRKLDD
jgi:hypothetical protein